MGWCWEDLEDGKRINCGRVGYREEGILRYKRAKNEKKGKGYEKEEKHNISAGPETRD